MKTILASLVLLLSACKATAPAVSLPVPAFADGTAFALPCPDHGSHLQTITGHSVGVIYTIQDEQGNVQEVPELLLQQVLEAFGVGPIEVNSDRVGRCSGK